MYYVGLTGSREASFPMGLVSRGEIRPGESDWMVEMAQQRFLVDDVVLDEESERSFVLEAVKVGASDYRPHDEEPTPMQVGENINVRVRNRSNRAQWCRGAVFAPEPLMSPEIMNLRKQSAGPDGPFFIYSADSEFHAFRVPLSRGTVPGGARTRFYTIAPCPLVASAFLTERCKHLDGLMLEQALVQQFVQNVSSTPVPLSCFKGRTFRMDTSQMRGVIQLTIKNQWPTEVMVDLELAGLALLSKEIDVVRFQKLLDEREPFVDCPCTGHIDVEQGEHAHPAAFRFADERRKERADHDRKKMLEVIRLREGQDKA